MELPQKHYNTSETPLRLPGYGRLVTQMVEHAKQIKDRQERTAYAYRIIDVMEMVNDGLRQEDNYEQKLWNHLALIAHYELDIDYPVPIRREDEYVAENKLTYPGNSIKYRHYGHLVEQLMAQIAEMPAGAQRDETVRAAAKRMCQDLMQWRGDRGNVEDRVAYDIEEYTHGAVKSEQVIALLSKPAPAPISRRGRKQMKGGRG